MNKEKIEVITGERVKELKRQNKFDIVTFSELLNEITEDERDKISNILEKGDNGALSRKRFELDWTKETMSDSIENGQTSAITVNGEVIATSSYRFWGEDENGNEVYMISKLAILPEYERQGLSKMLIQSVFDQIRKEHPKALILICSKRHAVKKQIRSERPEWKERKAEWRKIGIKEMAKLLGKLNKKRDVDSKESIASMKKEEVEGYEAFLFKP